MRKKVIIAVVVGLVIGLGLFFILQNKSQAPSKSEQQVSQEEVINESYTKEQVAVHNSESDCWTIISGSVYDITSYIPRHPGGDEILLACGVDGTTLFTGRTTAEGEVIGSGEPHSSSAQDALSGYKIGTLTQ